MQTKIIFLSLETSGTMQEYNNVEKVTMGEFIYGKTVVIRACEITSILLQNDRPYIVCVVFEIIEPLIDLPCVERDGL